MHCKKYIYNTYTGCETTIKAAKALAANNMIKQIENIRDEIQVTIKDMKPVKAVTTPSPTSNSTPKTEKNKIHEIDPQSQMNPLALVNQLFSPEITVEEVCYYRKYIFISHCFILVHWTNNSIFHIFKKGTNLTVLKL